MEIVLYGVFLEKMLKNLNNQSGIKQQAFFIIHSLGNCLLETDLFN